MSRRSVSPAVQEFELSSLSRSPCPSEASERKMCVVKPRQSSSNRLYIGCDASQIGQRSHLEAQSCPHLEAHVLGSSVPSPAPGAPVPSPTPGASSDSKVRHAKGSGKKRRLVKGGHSEGAILSVNCTRSVRGSDISDAELLSVNGKFKVMKKSYKNSSRISSEISSKISSNNSSNNSSKNSSNLKNTSSRI